MSAEYRLLLQRQARGGFEQKLGLATAFGAGALIAGAGAGLAAWGAMRQRRRNTMRKRRFMGPAQNLGVRPRMRVRRAR